MKEHKYGFNYEEDIRNLYGANCELLSNKRIQLFESFIPNIPEVKALRDIIQNPIPITKDQFEEWCNTKDGLIKKYDYYLSEHDKNILNEIKNFVYVYHVDRI